MYGFLVALDLLSQSSLVLHFEIALEQAQGCVNATTETTWRVMLVLLQSWERLRPLGRRLPTTVKARLLRLTGAGG